jgi:hypothetical protein
MSWFKKGQKKPKDLSAVDLFKPYPNTLGLALVRPTLLDWVQGKIHRETPSDLYPTPNSFYTPYGLYEYDGTSKLALISVACVSETGTIADAHIRVIYLTHILSALATSLNQDVDTFFNTVVEGEKIMIIGGVEGVDPPRLMYSTVQEAIDAMKGSQQNASTDQILAIRDIASALYSPMAVSNPLQTPTAEYYFTYWANTIDSKTIEKMRRLENIVAYCRSNNLSVLPSPEREGWSVDVLQPFLNHIRDKISEDRRKVDLKL